MKLAISELNGAIELSKILEYTAEPSPHHCSNVENCPYTNYLASEPCF
jgi:hypothetical protein